MAGVVRVEVHRDAVAAMAHDPGVADFLMDAGRRVADLARVPAPKRTGAGAASIHAEPVHEPDGWTVRVSWDQDHDYMRFHDLGTRYLPALHFLENALDRYAQF